MACGITRRTLKLGHHVLLYISKFRRSEHDNDFLMAKNHRENILKRTIACFKVWFPNPKCSTNSPSPLSLYSKLIILPYAFKMRQDYLSTSYLDQKYLPSERSEMRGMWIDPSNVWWDNLVSFWKHMVIFFSYLSLFYRWNLIRM